MLDTAASSGRHCLGTVSISETQLTSFGGIPPVRPNSGPATVNRMSLHGHLLSHVGPKQFRRTFASKDYR